MRDVEAVEGLSTQLFLSILNIALNIGVALVVTISKSRIVFIFFLLTTPGGGNYHGYLPEYYEEEKYGVP